MGTLFIGRPGSGKTNAVAKHVVEEFRRHPDQAIFVLDWSGSLSDTILALIAQDKDKDQLLKRVVYDEMGNPEWVNPLPEFSALYGTSYEEQVQRLTQNLIKLNPELVKNAPYIAGLGLREIAPEIFRLLTAMTNEYGETWQVTEVKRLIKDGRLLKLALNQFGQRAPQAKWYFQNAFLPLKEAEKELRTFSIVAILGALETEYARARVGYYRPGWTPQEAIQKGLLVIVNGARLINQRSAQHYLFTQVYSLIMEEINKRVPGDPKNKRIKLVADEVQSLIFIPGMAQDLAMVSPLYRSRGLELYIVLQSLSQMAEELRAQIWTLGNLVCFAVSNFDEAYEIAQQIFKYQPQNVKLSPRTDTQQPVLETDRGQYLQIANDIQRMNHRECLVRRYLSERVLDPHVRWVQRTRENPQGAVNLSEIKQELLQERGVRIRDALKVVNERNLGSGSGMPDAPMSPKRPPEL